MKAVLLALLFASTTAMAGPACIVNTDGVTLDVTHVLTAAPCLDGGMTKVAYVCVHTDTSDQTIKLSANNDRGFNDMDVAKHITGAIADTMRRCKQ